ncbi:hypothetical protein Pyn_37362 [Prunus yedoensis var. nudiflora]|uniref:Uncharacterized protein n=1 Tax=Prunus yedoensis var. nudiflora TaxID=2094558 RepID=A0A314ZJU3_PRUYE|nr:hypothetical protein Pyn_37362 [Prunus yedoensis var. nudiflora]
MTATFVANAAISSIANVAISSAAVISVTATTTATSTRLGLVDDDVTAVKVLAVYAFDRILHGLLVVEGEEVEALGPLGLMVVDDLRFGGGGKSRPHGSRPESTS